MINKIIASFVFCLTFNFYVYSSSDPEILPQAIQSPTETYHVEKKLGEGVFGKVYLVTDSQGQKFAIKAYKTIPDFGINAGPFTDAKREYERGQLFDHPNILKSIDYFSTSSYGDSDKAVRPVINPEETASHYVVLEYVEGKTIAGLEPKILNHGEMIKYSQEIINALRYALKLEMLDLDMHLGNVMISKNSQVKIIDISSFFSFEELLSFNSVQTQEDEKTEKTEESFRHKKIQAYLARNPALLEKLNQFQFQGNRENTFLNQKKGDGENKKIREAILGFYYSYYLEQITDLCIELHSKSDCRKDDKLNLKAKMKWLCWNYEADIEDGNYLPIEWVLDQISVTLQTH